MYNVSYTDSTKDQIAIADRSLDKTTSVTLVGKNYNGYGNVISDNFLHLLENFANSEPPGISPGRIGPPVVGQLWFDTSTTQLKIKTNDGWIPTSGVTKSSTSPENKTAGDLWVDTTHQQLFVYSGTRWLLVGPQFNSGSVSGVVVESLIASDNATREVVAIKNNSVSIMIVNESDDFTPKSAIPGFQTVKRGVTISDVYRISGTITNSDKLNNIAASSYARTDLDQQFDRGVSVAASIKIGANKSLELISDGTNSTIASVLPIILKVGTVQALAINTQGNVAIDHPVSITGSITGSGTLTITGTTTDSIKTAGSAIIGKSITVGNNITIYNGSLSLGKQNDAGALLPGSIIIPDANTTYDIGQLSDQAGANIKRFRNVYAQHFDGTTFTGTTFTGTTFSGTANAIAPTGISGRQAVTDSLSTDQFLIYRADPAVLYKTTKASIMSPMIGSVILFAGSSYPAGYHLCDGSTLSRTTYVRLWQIMGSPDTGDSTTTFNLPVLDSIGVLGSTRYIIYTGDVV